MNRSIAFTLLMSLLAWCTPAQGESDNAARAAFRKGVRYFEAADYTNAVDAFRQANELNPSWKIQYNIGQCEAALKHHGLALEALELYVSRGGDEITEDREGEVLSEIARLKQKIGTVKIIAAENVQIEIDGIVRGVTPVAAGIRVPAGVGHQVRLFENDAEILSQEITVGTGQTVTVNTLETEPDPDEVDTGESVETFSADGGKPLKPLFFWIGAGATVAFGGATLALYLATDGKIDEIKNNPTDDDLRSTGKSLQGVGIACLALTAAAAVTTGVLAYFTDFSRERTDEAPVALMPYTVLQGGGLQLAGRF